MKNSIKSIALSVITATIIATGISSCTKPIKDTTPVVVVDDVPQAVKSIPLSCKFNGNNTEIGCTNELGFCMKQAVNLEELEALTLAADEAKGQGWARKLANGNIEITISLGTTNLSPNTLGKWIDQKTMIIASDCLLPDGLIENCLRTDKITFPKPRVIIPKGTHPLTVTLAGNSNKTPEVVLKVTVNPKCEYVGHVTLLR